LGEYKIPFNYYYDQNFSINFKNFQKSKISDSEFSENKLSENVVTPFFPW
jgi:hypothetical protein